jgi:hypothetical protein
VRVTTELHDCDLFFDFVFLAAEVVGDGQVRPRARDSLPLELVEPVGAGVVARHDFDSLREKRGKGASSTNIRQGSRRARRNENGGGGEARERGRVMEGVWRDEMKKEEERREGKTHDFNAVLSEIPTFVDGTVLALAHGGTAKVVVQYDTSGEMIAIATAGPGLVYAVGDAHIRGRVKGRAAHDL